MTPRRGSSTRSIPPTHGRWKKCWRCSRAPKWTRPGRRRSTYQLAYGHWKLAQFYAQPRGRSTGTRLRSRSARKAAQRCAKQAKAAIERDARMAEAVCNRGGLCGFCSGRAAAEARPPVRAAARCGRRIDPGQGQSAVQLIEALCAGGKSRIPQRSTAGEPSSRRSKPRRLRAPASPTGAMRKR